MKAMLKKEMRLGTSSLSYFFLCFGCMTMIPGYPITLGAFFVGLGIFYSFQLGRESNDILYTALLPIPKAHVVKAKYLMALGLEGVAFLLMLLLTVLRMGVLSQAGVYVENPLMNANLAFLGYALMIFAAFNGLFLPGFFKTGYYIGKPFIAYALASSLIVIFAEVLFHFPGMMPLHDTTPNGMQAIVLAAGAALFLFATALGYSRSKTRFEMIDL